jgi:hypothetical protein
MTAPFVAIVLGALMLFFGRTLFWLFVGIAGFLIGFFLAPAIFTGMSDVVRVLVGIGIGMVFALLAVFFTRFMVAVAGFFMFGPAAVLLVRYLGADAPDGTALFWVAYVVGGIIGFVLLWAFLDWALIVLTALAGAWGIVQGVGEFAELSPTWRLVLYVVLAVIGIGFQAWSYRSRWLARGPTRPRR